jgi:hypothetical protein
MATKQEKEDQAGLVERLAGRGEEAVSRFLDEVSRNPRVADALDRAMSAKGRVDSASRAALSQVGVAAAEEIKDLRSQLERLEKRLARLEGGVATGTTAAPRSAKRSETKKTPSAKKKTTRVKTEAEKAPSPPPGRALGGGTGRGSPGGTGTAA